MKGGPWRKVDVTLPEGDDRNHYDDSGNSANHDLEAEPGEAVGIFFGLEVIDGSQYTLERSKTSSNNHCIMKIRNSDSAVAGEKEEQQRKKRPNPETSVSTSDSNEQTPSSPSDERPIDSEKPRKKQKKKKKKSKSLEKKKSQIQTNNSDDKAGRKTDPYKVTSMAVDNDDEETQENPSIQDLQLRWMSATGGVQLHERLCQGLSRQGFQDPSPIQAATLPVAIFGRRNIVGAAPTGSGKTLAFLLPIFQFLLEEQEAAVHRTLELKALILSPTRELALQIHQEAIKLTAQKSMIACLTGGLAIAKQQRVLSNRPPVIVATPGRLWDLVSLHLMLGRKLECMIVCICQGRNSKPMQRR
jgi:ATP-dependent RNA helicase DDX24/MAK5